MRASHRRSPPAADCHFSRLAGSPLTREHVGVFFFFLKAVLLPRPPRAGPIPLTEYKKTSAAQGGAVPKPSRAAPATDLLLQPQKGSVGLSRLCRKSTSELSNEVTKAFSGVISGGKKGIS